MGTRMNSYIEKVENKVRQDTALAVELDAMIQEHITLTAEKLTQGLKGETLCKESVAKGCALAWISRLVLELKPEQVTEIIFQLQFCKKMIDNDEQERHHDNHHSP